MNANFPHPYSTFGAENTSSDLTGFDKNNSVRNLINPGLKMEGNPLANLSNPLANITSSFVKWITQFITVRTDVGQSIITERRRNQLILDLFSSFYCCNKD